MSVRHISHIRLGGAHAYKLFGKWTPLQDKLLKKLKADWTKPYICHSKSDFLSTSELSCDTCFVVSSRREPLVLLCALPSIRKCFKALIKLPTFQHPRCSRHLFHKLAAASCFRQQQSSDLSWQILSTQRTLNAHVTFWPYGKCTR